MTQVVEIASKSNAGGADKEQIDTPQKAFNWRNKHFGLALPDLNGQNYAPSRRVTTPPRYCRDFRVTPMLFELCDHGRVTEQIRLGISPENASEIQIWMIGEEGVILVNSEEGNPSFPYGGAILRNMVTDPDEFSNLVFGIVHWLSQDGNVAQPPDS